MIEFPLFHLWMEVIFFKKQCYMIHNFKNISFSSLVVVVRKLRIVLFASSLDIRCLALQTTSSHNDLFRATCIQFLKFIYAIYRIKGNFCKNDWVLEATVVIKQKKGTSFLIKI